MTVIMKMAMKAIAIMKMAMKAIAIMKVAMKMMAMQKAEIMPKMSIQMITILTGIFTQSRHLMTIINRSYTKMASIAVIPM